MKTCSNCGHENANAAAVCEECGWRVPKLHPYARAGRILKLAAGSGIVALVVAQIVGVVAVGMTVTEQMGEPSGPAAIFAFYSWRCFLVAMASAATLFWLGDYLKRTY
jgi:hypothetical protein